MPFELTGARIAAFAAISLVSLGLSACTTTEGTNAFTSAQTFETEVMDKTAAGLGLIPQEVKPDPTNPRGPLVMPKDTKTLPPPEKLYLPLSLMPAIQEPFNISVPLSTSTVPVLLNKMPPSYEPPNLPPMVEVPLPPLLRSRPALLKMPSKNETTAKAELAEQALRLAERALNAGEIEAADAFADAAETLIAGGE